MKSLVSVLVVVVNVVLIISCDFFYHLYVIFFKVSWWCVCRTANNQNLRMDPLILPLPEYAQPQCMVSLKFN